MSRIDDQGWVDLKDLRDHIRGKRINPEYAYRQILREDDDPKDTRYGEYCCELEDRDHTAFRQGVVEYADAQEKSGEWFTFDNGDTYYTRAQLKEFLEHYPVDEFDYDEDLLKVLEPLI